MEEYLPLPPPPPSISRDLITPTNTSTFNPLDAPQPSNCSTPPPPACMTSEQFTCSSSGLLSNSLRTSALSPPSSTPVSHQSQSSKDFIQVLRLLVCRLYNISAVIA